MFVSCVRKKTTRIKNRSHTKFEKKEKELITFYVRERVDKINRVVVLR